MISLRGASYNLPFDTLVVAEVTAKNAVGWGPVSDDNTIGAKI
jgi:hypothetical protein